MRKNKNNEIKTFDLFSLVLIISKIYVTGKRYCVSRNNESDVSLFNGVGDASLGIYDHLKSMEAASKTVEEAEAVLRVMLGTSDKMQFRVVTLKCEETSSCNETPEIENSH